MSPEELEFDLPENIEAIHGILAKRHAVLALESTRDIDRWLPALVQFKPDVAFCLAEGFYSAVREAFYPALFEQLKIPCIGSDATTMMFAQNKALAKIAAQSADVPTPKWIAVATREDLIRFGPHVLYPAIVKPNSEGSSIGIDRGSVVFDHEQLEARVSFIWNELRNIALVEEFIPNGLDLSISYVQGLGPEVFGPVAYDIGKDDLYDFKWKSESYLYLDIVTEPKDLSTHLIESLHEAMVRLIKSLDLRGYGRADFRLGADGRYYFIEMNGQIELAEKAEFAAPIVRAGYSYEQLVYHILDTALLNQGRLPSSAGIPIHLARLFSAVI